MKKTIREALNWAYEAGYDDLWWVSLNGVSQQESVSGEVLEELIEVGEYSSVRVLQISQVNELDNWIEIETFNEEKLPSRGEHKKKSDVDRDESPKVSKFQKSCPACGSLEAFYKVSVLYEAEVSDIKTNTRTVGVGVSGGGIGIGSASSETQGKVESLLVDKLRPPEKKPEEATTEDILTLFGGVAILYSVIFLGIRVWKGKAPESVYTFWIDPWFCAFIGLVGIACFVILFKMEPSDHGVNERRYNEQMKYWNKMWFCKRCGEFHVQG